MSASPFLCSTCGQEHPGLPMDYGFRLPDCVHGLRYLDRYLRSRSNADLCTLDEKRHFIRGVLPLPLTESGDEFCWGVWVEVSRQCHEVYVGGFEEDLSTHRGMAGRLANQIPGYGQTLGERVVVYFQSAGSRPLLAFASGSAHALALEQRHGISAKRHHSLLEAVGFFDRNQ